jgi:hypothetical protein
MPELKAELMSGVADFQSELKTLDSCLARLIRAEENLQRDLRRLARLERWLDPRCLAARVQLFVARWETRLPAAP